MTYKTQNTSSIKGESLANCEDEEEFVILDPVREPLPKLVMKWEVGADPLHVSAWSDMFCWLGELFFMVNLEFSSSMRFVNSSILSLRAEIWSESWLIAPYKILGKWRQKVDGYWGMDQYKSDYKNSVSLQELTTTTSNPIYLIYWHCGGI